LTVWRVGRIEERWDAAALRAHAARAPDALDSERADAVLAVAD
jgi:hypothetical protein